MIDANSVGKAFRASLATLKVKQKRLKPVGVELLSYRYANDLDLWTGEPRHVDLTSEPICDMIGATDE